MGTHHASVSAMPRTYLAVLCFSACTGDLSPPVRGEDRTPYTLDDNGLTPNGLGDNGLNANGLNANGLNANGLNANGLKANPLFADWFNSTAYVNQENVMRYLVQCALPAGRQVAWTNPVTRISYTWGGKSGLAPDWYKRPATDVEQQWVSACLFALVNTAGQHVTVSLTGGHPARKVSFEEDNI
jgi:hypothetical protein